MGRFTTSLLAQFPWSDNTRTTASPASWPSFEVLKQMHCELSKAPFWAQDFMVFQLRGLGIILVCQAK